MVFYQRIKAQQIRDRERDGGLEELRPGPSLKPLYRVSQSFDSF